MDDLRLGTAVRVARQSRGWRQSDVAARARVSQPTISRIERGHVASLSVGCLREVGAALEIRLDIVPRWRGGDLDRLLNRAHSALHESVARWFRDVHPSWSISPEVSFAYYGERGVIDILGWHPDRRALLVIELKTDVVDVNELLGTLDRKRRLAPRVAAERGWQPVATSSWLIVLDTRTNRRRVEAHAAMLAGALPDERRAVQRWLRDPRAAVGGLSFWTVSHPRNGRQRIGPVRRVRTTSNGQPQRGPGR